MNEEYEQLKNNPNRTPQEEIRFQVLSSMFEGTGNVSDMGVNVADNKNYLPFSNLGGINTLTDTDIRSTGSQAGVPQSTSNTTDNTDNLNFGQGMMAQYGFDPTGYRYNPNEKEISPTTETYTMLNGKKEKIVGSKVESRGISDEFKTTPAPTTPTNVTPESQVTGNKTNNLEENLNLTALMANALGAGVSLDSALYSLGDSLGTDKKGPSNTVKGVSALGKVLLGGARSGLSGFSNAKRNNYVNQYNEDQIRESMLGNYVENPQYRQNPGGGYFGEDGGEIGFLKDISKYLDGGTSNENPSVGDTISFKDAKGNLMTGVIKSIKNGEIEIEG